VPTTADFELEPFPPSLLVACEVDRRPDAAFDKFFLNWLELARFLDAATACIAAPSTDFPINLG
jgi:hypothetical protein